MQVCHCPTDSQYIKSLYLLIFIVLFSLFWCPLSLCYLTTARPYDFLTEVAYGVFEPGENEACVELEIVDSEELELTESLLVEIELLHTTLTITMSPTMSFGYIQIVDDDSMFKIYCMSTYIII